MGSVYHALDHERGRSVAVKIVDRHDDSDLSARFAREIEVLADLRHPGIVEYIAHGFTVTGEPYLVMEWLDGRNLKQRLGKNILSEVETVSVGIQVASALSVAHRRGIIHRDIKPENLFLTGNDLNRVKLIDFGIAHLDATRTALTTKGLVMGTPSFMAPEQARSERPIDQRADLYSLGAVLFTCLAGRPPFVADHVMAILAKMHFEEAPRVSSLRQGTSPDLDDLIDRLLAKDPHARPGSADEVASLLCGIARAPRASAVRSTPAVAVSSGEQRYVSILLVGRTGMDDRSSAWASIGALTANHGARLERLTDDMLFAAFTDQDDAGETARRAARLALSLRPLQVSAPIVLATGRGLVSERLPVGEAIDRAVDLLVQSDTVVVDGGGLVAAASPQQVVIDELTASLLDRRFHTMRRGDGKYLLVGESEKPRPGRKLLGKRIPCVGRDREIATVVAIARECIEDSVATAVLVTGQAGSGKSRLGYEIAAQLSSCQPAPRIFAAYGDSMRTGSALGLVGQLIRHAMAIESSASPSAQKAAIRTYTSQLAAGRTRTGSSSDNAGRMAAFLGEIAGLPFLADGLLQLSEARRDARLMHDQMLLTWEDWLDGETARNPVVLLIDDLQWSDVPSIRFINAALRDLEDRPLLVLAMARSEVDQVFPDLWASRQLDRLALRPLSKRACATIVEQAMPEGVGEATVKRLVERSGGNPFYLEELLRSAADSELDELPDTVLAIVAARLRALPPSERRVLRAASVFGRTFWLGGLAELLGDHVRVIESFVNRLAERELIVARRSSRFAKEREYSFAHDLTHEAAYATLPARDRQNAHLSAGLWLDSAGETDAITLAEHYHRGGDRERAVPGFQRVAEQALAADHLKAAIDYAERAVDCGAHGETLGALRLIQAEASNWKNDSTTAQQCGHEAFELLTRGSTLWAHAAHQLAWASGDRGDIDTLVKLARELESWAPEHLDGLYLAAVVHCATHLMRHNRDGDVTQLEQLVRDRTDPDTASPASAASIAVLNLAKAYHQGNAYVAVQWSEKALSHFEDLGYQRNSCLQLLQLGTFLRELGHYERSISALRSGLEKADRLELEQIARGCRAELAVTFMRVGRIDEAEALLLSVPVESSDRHSVSRLQLFKAQLQLLTGSLADATRELDHALELVNDSEFPALYSFAQALQSQALLVLGRPREALAAARAAMQIIETVGPLDQGESLVRLAYAEALDACGQREQARQVLATARSRLLDHAAQIEDPAWRKAFLDNIAEHRRTLKLWRTWNADEPAGELS